MVKLEDDTEGARPVRSARRGDGGKSFDESGLRGAAVAKIPCERRDGDGSERRGKVREVEARVLFLAANRLIQNRLAATPGMPGMPLAPFAPLQSSPSSTPDAFAPAGLLPPLTLSTSLGLGNRPCYS